MNTPYSAALAAALIHFVWEGTLIALVLALLLAMTLAMKPANRPNAVRVRYAFASLALIAMVVVFLATLVVVWPRAAVPDGNRVIAWVNVPQLAWPSPAALQIPWEEHLWWLSPAWLLGVLLFSLRTSAGWFAVRRLRRTGVCEAPEFWQNKLRELAARLRVSRPIALLESSLTDGPVVAGFLRPVILFPAGLLTGFPAEQIEYFLLHELAHISRWDYLVNILQSFAENLLFYHPAVWWVSSVIRAEREKCCDDVAASQGSAHGLAAALAALAEQRCGVRQLALAASGGRLSDRIRRLLGHSETGRAAVPSILAVAFLAAIGVSIGAAQRQAPAPAQQTAPSVTRLPDPYQKWLEEEAVYIIQPEKKAAFERLTTEDERQRFIEQFWQRRDPTPGTPENEYREEHYRRIAYVNDRFGYSPSPGYRVEGWRSDRGQVYIKFGPPDEKEEHPSGGTYDRPIEQGGGSTTVYAFEKWRYRYIEGIGYDVNMEFVDPNKTGEYRMTRDPNEKAPINKVPNNR